MHGGEGRGFNNFQMPETVAIILQLAGELVWEWDKENIGAKKWKIVSLMVSLSTEVTSPEVLRLLFMWGDIVSLLFELNYL